MGLINDLSKMTVSQLRKKADRLQTNWDNASFHSDWMTCRERIEKLQDAVAAELNKREDERIAAEEFNKTHILTKEQAVAVLTMIDNSTQLHAEFDLTITSLKGEQIKLRFNPSVSAPCSVVIGQDFDEERYEEAIDFAQAYGLAPKKA